MSLRKLLTGRRGYEGLLGLAGLLSLLVAAMPVARWGQHREADDFAARCADAGGLGAKGGGAKDPNSKAPPSPQVERIAKRNVFSPPPAAAARPFTAKLIGVLGDEALFEGTGAVAVGGQIGEWRVAAIGPDWVEVEQGGRKQKLDVFSATASPGGGPPRGGAPSMGGGPGGPSMAASAGPRPDAGGPPGGMNITPEMIAQFKALPPDVRQKALEQMPPDMRAKVLAGG
jgi:hypothetical protein